MPRPRTKTETLTFRVDLEVKRALADAAAGERRSMANMLELIILKWCEKHPSQGTNNGADKTNPRRGSTRS